MQLDPLPAAYYYYFWLFEPIVSLPESPASFPSSRTWYGQTSSARLTIQVLSITSALISSLDPQSSAADLLPKGLEVSTQDLGSTIRGKTVIRTLSSCECLISFPPRIRPRVRYRTESAF